MQSDSSTAATIGSSVVTKGTQVVTDSALSASGSTTASKPPTLGSPTTMVSTHVSWEHLLSDVAC